RREREDVGGVWVRGLDESSEGAAGGGGGGLPVPGAARAREEGPTVERFWQSPKHRPRAAPSPRPAPLSPFGPSRDPESCRTLVRSLPLDLLSDVSSLISSLVAAR